MSVASHCVKVCTVNSGGICVGCFRSLNEIACWSQLSDEDKLLVLQWTVQRRSQSTQLSTAEADKSEIEAEPHSTKISNQKV